MDNGPIDCLPYTVRIRELSDSESRGTNISHDHLLAYRDATAICESSAPLPFLGFLGMRIILGTKCRVPLGVEMR
jgi:hypothetical protein